MSDYDTILHMLEIRGIKFSTSWIGKKITIRSFSHMYKKVNLIVIKFSSSGNLELITALPEFE